MINLNEFSEYKYSDKSGLYALFIKDKKYLSEIFLPEFCTKIVNLLDSNSCENCIYIGKEQNKLYERIENDHKNGNIRHSTLRYTISYCAGMQRYSIIGTKIKDNRKIINTDENIITNWIKGNTYFKIIETDNYKFLEKEFINKYRPPLNINYNPKPMLKRGERASNFKFIDEKDFEKL